MKEEHIKLIEEFEAWLELKNYKPRGIEEKIRAARDFCRYAEGNEVELFSLNISEAENYREYLRLKTANDGKKHYDPKTINIRISYMKMFYSFLFERSMVLSNPFSSIERMRESQNIPKNILSIEQMEKLLDSMEMKTKEDVFFKVFVEMLYSTGARISEIENLSRKDIYEDEGYILIRDDKCRQDRRAPLNEYSQSLLKKYLSFAGEDSEYLFARGKKRTIDRWMNDRLKRLTVKLKLPLITCHGIRHSTATHLFKNGADIREVQELLGHRRIKNTEVYTRIFPEELKAVIEKNHPRECQS